MAGLQFNLVHRDIKYRWVPADGVNRSGIILMVALSFVRTITVATSCVASH